MVGRCYIADGATTVHNVAKTKPTTVTMKAEDRPIATKTVASKAALVAAAFAVFCIVFMPP